MDALAATPLKWLFSRCVFEESTLELSVAGRLVELERKPLEVLRHLLRHAGEVLTKEEIHAAVWPGRVLSDTVLTKAVSRIREVLGDETQALIKTVHGYGYRLIAPVTVETASARSAPPALGLKAGDSPPLRAQWKLETHLGSGGSGEVWKVVHAKTGDVRVYKFALDAVALDTLKREITSRVFNWMLKIYLGTRFSDGMCGFKWLRREHLPALMDGGAVSNGWFFSSELLAIAEWKGLKLCELPVHWTDDTTGSKVDIPRLAQQYIKAMQVLKKRK